MSESKKTGLRVFSSNSMEVLADLCAVIMSEYPLQDPFSREKIVVMNLGMQTFLTQRIAMQNKITALCDFLQVWQLIYQTHRTIHPFASKESLFDREHVTWNIYAQIASWEKDFNAKAFGQGEGTLGSGIAGDGTTTEGAANVGAASAGVYVDEAAKEKAAVAKNLGFTTDFSYDPNSREDLFAKLRYYVSTDEYGDKAYELAAKIADTFDQYQMYRPRWIKAWNFFTFEDFDNYERDPDDPANQINIFIERECERFRREKSGFRSVKHASIVKSKLEEDLNALNADLAGINRRRLELEAVIESEGEARASVQRAMLNTLLEDEAKIRAQITDLENRAEFLVSEDESDLEQNSSLSHDRVDMVRQLFKSNVWQMKLWRMLRTNIDLNAITSLSGVSKTDEIYRWTVKHLDRSQVMEGLIHELFEAGRPDILDDDDEIDLDSIEDPVALQKAQEAIAKKIKLREERNERKKRLPQLYERVFIFGVSSMPRVVIEFIDALALHCNVNLMLLNPCREYWGDISSRYRRDFDAYVKNIQASYKDVASMKLNYKKKLMQVPLYSLYERDYDDSGERVDGHPLLLAYGQQGRDNIYMLVDREFPPDIIPCYPDNEYDEIYDVEERTINGEMQTIVRGGTLLSRIQYQLLNLEHAKERYVISHDDYSLSIHSCHTKRREVEILQDAILECFNRAKLEGRKLLPRDIVVMVPTINDYAPHIMAVFGNQNRSTDKDFIPFVISDQTETDANTVAQSLLQLLEISTTRITSAMVIDLLAVEAIANRFGLSRDDVDVIANWLSENNIFWGLDDDDVKEFSEIPIPGTFAQGMDRMLLGSLLGENNEMPCFSEIEGSDANILGKFWDFLQALRELRGYFTPQLALEPEVWAIQLDRMLTKRFFDESEDTLRSLKSVQKVITELQTVISHLINKPKINLPVFAATLRQGLTAQRNFRPFLREKVNFCSLVPMRAVPFEHVFILGLNDIDFPREERAPGFNLMGSRDLFERGDRSRAIDDRFLFLEAILSARRSLYLSYIGQSPIDKSTLNPSVVLSELMYYINDMCTVEGLGEVDTLTRQQAVENRIITYERLNSYHIDNYKAGDNPNFVFKSQPKDASNVSSDAQSLNDASALNNAHALNAQKGASLEQAKNGAVKGSKGSKLKEPNKTSLESNPIVVDESVGVPHYKVPSFNRSFIQVPQYERTKVNILGSGIFESHMENHAYKVLELNELKGFIKDPSKYFLNSVLDLRIQDFGRYNLLEDENFEMANFSTSVLISDLLSMSKDLWIEYLERKATLGDLPYGIFKNELCHGVLDSANEISESLSKLFGFDTLVNVKDITCPKHEFFLSLKKSLFNHTELPVLSEIVSDSDSRTKDKINLYKVLNLDPNTGERLDLSKAQSTGASSAVVLEELGETLKSGAGAAVFSESGNGSAVADSYFVDSSDELSDCFNFVVTLHATCRSRPLIVYFFSVLEQKEKEYFNSRGAKVKLLESSISSPRVVLDALFEAISQYLYDGRLQNVIVVDKSGQVFTFKAFESTQEANEMIKSLIILYLQGLAAPMPALSTFVKKLTFDENGEISMSGQTDINFAYDKHSEYLYRNFEYVFEDKVLKTKVYNFLQFYVEKVAPRFVTLSSSAKDAKSQADEAK